MCIDLPGDIPKGDRFSKGRGHEDRTHEGQMRVGRTLSMSSPSSSVVGEGGQGWRSESGSVAQLWGSNVQIPVT